MKPGKILSLGLLSAMLAACNSSTETAKGDAEREKVIPVVNALTKAAALQAGYGISREVVGNEKDMDFFNEEMTKELQALGICDNFIELAKEITQSVLRDKKFNWMTSSRFMDIVSCMESNAGGLGEGAGPDAAMAVIDQCICGGSGTLFGSLGYSWSGQYKSPQLNVYKAPNIGTYKSPDVGSYKSPTVPGYKSPAL